MEDKFTSKIAYCSKELNVKERIKFKDMTDSRPLNEVQNGEVLSVDYWGIVEIHNPKAENTDYSNVVVVTKDGTKFNTSSKSFYNAMDVIDEELSDADEEIDFTIKIIKKQSKNNSGQFLTAALV